MMQHDRPDVIVVGGGPGGASVASFVSMHGHRVVLLEREKFPRHQIGESLLPATVNGVCALLGVTEELKQANFTYKQGGTYKWGKHPTPWSFTFGPSTMIPGSNAFAYQVERSKFDQILLNRASQLGVDVREQHTVNGFIEEDGRITGVEFTRECGGKDTLRARIVVDASGNTSGLSRHVGERIYSKFFKNVALYCYFEGAKRLPEPRSGNILCEAFDRGWFWYIPLQPNLTSVGAVIGQEYSGMLKDGLETAMSALVDRTSIIKEFLAPATRVSEGPYGIHRVRKDYSYCHSRFWRQGAVLVGDSACFIDPIFSSGVHLATYSGFLAARSINSFLAGDINEKRCFNEFEQRYRREFSTFYQFLVAFYDMDKDLDSYFWEARKIVNSEEITNEPFIRLVSGVSETGEPLFQGAQNCLKSARELGGILKNAYEGEGASHDVNSRSTQPTDRQAQFLRELRNGANDLLTQAALGRRSRNAAPLFEGGLIPSVDGLSWSEDTAKELTVCPD